MRLPAKRWILSIVVLSIAASFPFPAGASELEGCFSIGPLIEFADMGPIDRWGMSAYSKSVEAASEAFTYTSIMIPALLLAAPQEDWVSIGSMYAGSLLLSWGLKELGKTLVVRKRPYMYFDRYPQTEVECGDYLESFPSGHAALAFTGASFFSFVFSQYCVDSPWKIPLIGASFACATAASALRVGSGNHFPSDVVVGSAIGAFSGFIIPWLRSLYENGKGKR